MWEDLVRLPLGRTSMRKFMMLFATLLVAVLGYSLLTSTSVFAADGNWNSDDTLQYDGKKYQGPATSDQPQDVPSGAMWYGTYDSAKKKAWVVFFDPSLKNGEQFSATTAGLITYTYTDTNGTQPGGVVLSNPGQQVQISITPRAPPASNSTSQPVSDCKIDGVGWLVCNASYWIAEGMDKIYELVESFLATKTLFGTNDAALRTWEFARNIANICFVIAFLVMIYGQITGGMVTNYTIRKVLPRLIIAAILVNVSYWVCVLFVDISNVLGYAVHDLFTAIREQVAGNAANGGDLSWQKLTAFILSGGAIGTIATIAATGGSITALSFLLVAALVASLFAVLVAFVILAARQAIILILVILSPLAFVAYILPNTEEWFTRWRKAFTTLLVFFPAFSVIFGGSQLAGNIIIQSANGSLGLVLLGLTVQVIPLFVTPILIRLSSGILSTVAGLANDRSKGVFDGAKNWARGNAELHKARAVRNGMNRIENGQRFRPTAFGARMAMGKTHRERMTSAYQAQAEASYERSRRGQRAYSETRIGEDQKANAKNHNEEMFQKRVAGYSSSTNRTAGARLREDNRYLGHRQTLQDSHAAHERADLYKGSMEAADEEHWKHVLAHDTSLRAIRTGTHLAQGRAKLSEDAMTNADERALQTQINQQANLRNLKIQSDVDTAHAQFQAANVTAAGKAQFQNEVIADRALRLMNVDTVRNEKEAATIENTLKQRAEANWQRQTRTDPRLQGIRLSEIEASDSYKKAEAEWNTLVENVRLDGASAAGVSPINSRSARTIQTLASDTLAAEKTTEGLMSIVKSRSEKDFATSADGRRINIRAQAAQDSLAATKAEEAALVQEWRTEKGREDLTDPDDIALAEQLQEADIQKHAQDRRTSVATDTANQEYAGKVISDEIIPGGTDTIASVAGGIAGATGVSQAKATATQVTFEAFGKAVSAEKTLVSRNQPREILGETIPNPSDPSAPGTVGLGSPNILDEPEERIAALAGKVASGGHHKSNIELWQRMGELRRQADQELAVAKASGNQADIDRANDHIGKVKSLEQQVMDDKGKIPFGASDADLGAAKVGNYNGNIYDSTRQRLNTNLSAADLANMDPDDIRLIFEMARSGKLNDEEIRAVQGAYEDWQNDDNLKSSIRPKHRSLLDPFASYSGGGNVSSFPQPGSPPPPGIDFDNFWDRQYVDGINSMTPRS